MTIGLLGFGTVGKGVYDILSQVPGLEVKYVLDLRDLPELGNKLTKDLNVILSDGEVDTVVELIGGMHPAYDFVKASLEAGKNVVTANKLMMSMHYGELILLAKEKGVTLRFSASAGGGIPWLVNLQRAHRISTLESVYGIMNGTTNYILDAMDTLGEEFDTSLAQAQNLGFAEADPSSDIDGLDTRHKTTLSANIAFGMALDDEKVDSFGIRYVKKCDIESARRAGYVLKLIGSAFRTGEEGGEVAAFVEPTLVPADTPEGNIHGCDNIIAFDGEYIGKTHFIGAGAGRYPTGYAVAQDCVDIAENPGLLYNEKMQAMEIANEKEMHSYYVRTDFLEDPFFASLEKKIFGAGYKTQKVSVREMHDFASRALKAGKEIFIAGFMKK
ncbi:MAG: homoserine dehydrogenase [Clostridia bacterium]|nr:homoserine dehydrogenase [Clostridia bacterium]